MQNAQRTLFERLAGPRYRLRIVITKLRKCRKRIFQRARFSRVNLASSSLEWPPCKVFMRIIKADAAASESGIPDESTQSSSLYSQWLPIRIWGYELINRTLHCRLKDFDSCSIYKSISSDRAFARSSALLSAHRRLLKEQITIRGKESGYRRARGV